MHWDLIGWRQCTYRPDRIDHAEVVDLPWWRVSYSFWWASTQTNCTTGNGPSVRRVLHTDRVVTVTVPEPAVADLRAGSDSHAVWRVAGWRAVKEGCLSSVLALRWKDDADAGSDALRTRLWRRFRRWRSR